MKKITALVILTAFIFQAWAGSQTITLSIPGMTCAACPITVKKAISKVEGVSKVEINFEKREASVSFDDSKTTLQQIQKASAEAGYPVSVKP